MCGIFGAVVGPRSPLMKGDHLERYMEQLFLLSESRGKEAAGVAFTNADAVTLYKAAVPARKMIRSRGYREALRAIERNSGVVAFIGHSRLVTDGAREVNRNNQPVAANGIVGIHNGIIVNHEELWRRHDQLQRQFEVDSEVIFALLREHLGQGKPIDDATRATYAELDGVASVAALFEDVDKLLLATNNGSLYFRHAPDRSGFVFASESYIVDQIGKRSDGGFVAATTQHLRPQQAVLVDLEKLEVTRFELLDAAQDTRLTSASRSAPKRVVDRSPADRIVDVSSRRSRPLDIEALERRFPYVSMRDVLKRCTRCVLPETMPFVDFDAAGVCSYCRNHQPLSLRGRPALEDIVAPHRRTDGRPDCVVGVSGGRDSMFGLHYIKRELGMNPVAYTYDWGMVTDLARRNVSRICGKLGIEHIIVSADIPKKREHIRKNVEAWLARPSLGTIPLFMAGDKAYFHHLKRVREQVGAQVPFLCENLLERTNFKTGFANVAPFFDDAHVYTLPVASKLSLLSFYAKEFWKNPRYLNASMWDSAQAFAFYYLIDRNYENLYAYVPWDEDVVESTLLNEYDFELAEDTHTTWRIGDGTAAFYNYIYYAIAGMTENDTFRSNQIRAGVLSRDVALERIDRENQPRFPSIKWYLDTIGLEQPIETVLDIIHSTDKLYARA